MTERPEGDEIDQLLRRGITALAESSGPEGANVVPVADARGGRRRAFLAVAAAVVLALLGIVLLRDESSVTIDAVGPDHEQSADALPDENGWTQYLEQSEPAEQVSCLLGWSLNRDLFFRIPGDQFAVSTTVTGFNVDSATAQRWAQRHTAGFGLLKSVVNSERALAIDDVLEALDAIVVEATVADQVDVAPVFTVASSTATAVFEPSGSCPLGPATENRATHTALARYSAGDTTPFQRAVSCVDAELDRVGPDAGLNVAELAAYLAKGPLPDATQVALWREDNQDCPVVGPSWG